MKRLIISIGIAVFMLTASSVLLSEGREPAVSILSDVNNMLMEKYLKIDTDQDGEYDWIVWTVTFDGCEWFLIYEGRMSISDGYTGTFPYEDPNYNYILQKFSENDLPTGVNTKYSIFKYDIAIQGAPEASDLIPEATVTFYDDLCEIGPFEPVAKRALPVKSFDDNVQIIPNPNNGIFRIKNLSNKNIESIMISDLNGRTILKQNTSLNNDLNLSQHSKGVYIVVVNYDDNSKVIGKLIIE